MRKTEIQMGILIVILVLTIIISDLSHTKLSRENKELQSQITEIRNENNSLKIENSLLHTQIEALTEIEKDLDKEEDFEDNSNKTPPETGITNIVRHVIFLYNKLGYDYNTEYYNGELKYIDVNKK